MMSSYGAAAVEIGLGLALGNIGFEYIPCEVEVVVGNPRFAC